jgi:hypothetical protein
MAELVEAAGKTVAKTQEIVVPVNDPAGYSTTGK